MSVVVGGVVVGCEFDFGVDSGVLSVDGYGVFDSGNGDNQVLILVVNGEFDFSVDSGVLSVDGDDCLEHSGFAFSGAASNFGFELLKSDVELFFEHFVGGGVLELFPVRGTAGRPSAAFARCGVEVGAESFNFVVPNAEGFFC